MADRELTLPSIEAPENPTGILAKIHKLESMLPDYNIKYGYKLYYSTENRVLPSISFKNGFHLLKQKTSRISSVGTLITTLKRIRQEVVISQTITWGQALKRSENKAEFLDVLNLRIEHFDSLYTQLTKYLELTSQQNKS